MTSMSIETKQPQGDSSELKLQVHKQENQAPGLASVLLLTLPQLGLMACHLAMSMTDLWVAGKLDSTVLAALGIVSQIYAVLMLLTSIVGSGCTATISQAVGGGKTQRAKRYALLVVWLALAFGGMVALLALLSLPLLSLLPISQNLLPVVRLFILAYALQLPFYYSMVMMNSILRAHKLVWLPFATLVVVCLTNFVGSVALGLGMELQLGPVSIHIQALGYAGIAWATLVSTVFGFICNILHIVRVGIIGKSSVASFTWCRIAFARLLNIGGPATLGALAAQAGSVTLLACLTGMEDSIAAVAGMTLGLRVQGFLLFPFAAFSMTLTLFAGHLLGARKGELCYFFGLRMAFFSMIVMAFCATALYLSRFALSGIFTNQVSTLHYAGQFIAISCLVLPLQSAVAMLHALFAGAGATRITCMLSCVCTWGVALPLAWLLGHGFAFGSKGVFISIALSQVLACVWTLKLYRQKKWLQGFLAS